MGKLAMVKPLPVAAIGGTLLGAARLLTPDPREAAARFAGGETRTIDVDLGAVQAVDTLFLGYATSATFPAIAVSYGVAAQGEAALAQPLAVAPTSGGAPYRHYLLILPAPIAARFWRLSLALGAGGTAGVLALGEALVVGRDGEGGAEWGGGRTLGDSTAVTRLAGGGVAVDPGATFGGYGWTFAGLTDAELARLYALARNRGVGRQLLVVEDTDAAPGLNERIRWSLFTRFDAYERLAPGETKWSLKVEDWL